MTDHYDDIIDLPHHVSPTRPQMPMSDRAAQFSPFAALVGYDAAIRETGRLTDAKVEMEDDALNDLDEKFQVLMDHLKEKPEIKITYFRADERKVGGAYLQVSGVVRKTSEFERKLILDDGIEIKLDDIVDLEGDIFKASLWQEGQE